MSSCFKRNSPESIGCAFPSDKNSIVHNVKFGENGNTVIVALLGERYKARVPVQRLSRTKADCAVSLRSGERGRSNATLC
jgi:hypothetical protein